MIGPWQFALVALAAWRTWKLLAEDTITDPLRARYIDGHEWRETFTECPWCSGFYVSLVMYGLWVWIPNVVLPVYAALAISASVGLLAMVSYRLAED